MMHNYVYTNAVSQLYVMHILVAAPRSPREIRSLGSRGDSLGILGRSWQIPTGSLRNSRGIPKGPPGIPKTSRGGPKGSPTHPQGSPEHPQETRAAPGSQEIPWASWRHPSGSRTPRDFPGRSQGEQSARDSECVVSGVYIETDRERYMHISIYLSDQPEGR